MNQVIKESEEKNATQQSKKNPLIIIVSITVIMLCVAFYKTLGLGNSIVGKWETQLTVLFAVENEECDGSSILELYFNEDNSGTNVIDSSKYGETISAFTYIYEGEVLTVNFEDGSMQSFDVYLHNDTMVLRKAGSNIKMILTKEKL